MPSPVVPAQRIAISGASGLVGGALTEFLTGRGHAVVPISRRGGGIAWDGREVFDAAGLRACDAIIHLAGAGIADRRWSAARRAEIRASRVVGTTALARLLAADPGRVRTLITASATGFYGSRGDERLDESSSPGTGFLAEVCRDWESAADACRDRVRVVQLRLGMVLSERGGALRSLLPTARLGLAGPLGDGRQWWSWIDLDDLLRVVAHVLATPTLSGPVNAVAPEPLRQREFAKRLAATVHRPAWGPPVPAWIMRLALGGVADAAILASARVYPRRLVESGLGQEAGGWRLEAGGAQA